MQIEGAGLPTVHEALAGGAASSEKTRMTPRPYACEHGRLAAHHRFSHPLSSRYASPSLESPSTFLPTTTRPRPRPPTRPEPLACSSCILFPTDSTIPFPHHVIRAIEHLRSPYRRRPRANGSTCSHQKSSCSIFCPLRCFRQHRGAPRILPATQLNPYPGPCSSETISPHMVRTERPAFLDAGS